MQNCKFGVFVVIMVCAFLCGTVYADSNPINDQGELPTIEWAHCAGGISMEFGDINPTWPGESIQIPIYITNNVC